MTGTRRAALDALRALFEAKRSFADTLDGSALGAFDAQDAALIRALAYGVARHRRLLDALLDRLLDRPLRPRQARLRTILLLGLFQLGWMRVPAHAAVNETVGLVRERWARGLVNAVLRRYARDGAPVELPGAPGAVRHSHPDWLAARLEADWGSAAERIMDENNREAPFWLRLDPPAGAREAWLALAGAKGIAATPGPTERSVRIPAVGDVHAIPGFEEGAVSVQDLAAQLAAPLLRVPAGGRILDACAAPGGKTVHLAALNPRCELVALDSDARRLGRLESNLRRCRADATVHHADAADLAAWWDGRPFDGVLIDAPCSGTGVIRRHPDIKWLRRGEDVDAQVAGQAALLEAGARVLAPGGCLVYTTCSLLRAENDGQLATFLARRAGLRADRLSLPFGQPAGEGWQLLPGDGGADGFFYARLVAS